ncbi:Inward rectifier potassium channel [Burkholderiaceae bacterium DAT-1]|nr:Inward rectifier potassium channel [Burkholderiaceae bacterium DAT-1]
MSLFHRHHRVIPFGEGKVHIHNMPPHTWHDLYHFALSAPWPVFFLSIAGVFMSLNVVFASLYMLGDDPIANIAPQGFWGAFFFSVETLATVGYGDMHPQTAYAHFIATLEIFLGMTSIALMTGAIFSRFSRPRARINFARHPVVGMMDGKRMLMIRTANARMNMILDASARLRLIRREVTQEGKVFRRIHDIELVRSEQPMFVLGWVLMHVIDENSPLCGCYEQLLEEQEASLILTMTGHDDSISQSIVTRHVYSAKDIRWNHRYIDVSTQDAQGVHHMDYQYFHAVEPEQSAVQTD